MTLYKYINGIRVELNSDEIDEYNQRQIDWEAGKNQRIIAEFTEALEVAINAKAAEKTYSSGVSCASYISSTNIQWSEEAAAFIAWRDNCYEYSYDYLAQAQSGQIPNPTIEDFISGLPVMEWPIT